MRHTNDEEGDKKGSAEERRGEAGPGMKVGGHRKEGRFLTNVTRKSYRDGWSC